MIPQITELDRNTIVTPLGLRFWDSLSMRPVSDGLLVMGYPVGQEERAFQAWPTRSGVFVFRHVPGLRAVERGAGDANFWATVSTSAPLVIEVADRDARFVSFRLRTAAPSMVC